MSKPTPRVLAIAGSDSSGGAGIQADIKTITMLSGYAMTAITSVTAQNTNGVQAVEVLSPDLVRKQIASCLNDIGEDAVKIGMVGSAANAIAIEQALVDTGENIVFDPVMVATSGAALADDETRAAFGRLMAFSHVVTPNLPELAALTDMPCETEKEIEAAATFLVERFGCSVLVKGGHGSGDTVVDYLFNAQGRDERYKDSRIDTRHTHGTGCTLSSAITTLLGHGLLLEDAVRIGRKFVREGLLNAPGFGEGAGPLGHQAVRQEP